MIKRSASGKAHSGLMMSTVFSGVHTVEEPSPDTHRNERGNHHLDSTWRWHGFWVTWSEKGIWLASRQDNFLKQWAHVHGIGIGTHMHSVPRRCLHIAFKSASEADPVGCRPPNTEPLSDADLKPAWARFYGQFCKWTPLLCFEACHLSFSKHGMFLSNKTFFSLSQHSLDVHCGIIYSRCYRVLWCKDNWVFLLSGVVSV